jgi:hypothetical protein
VAHVGLTAMLRRWAARFIDLNSLHPKQWIAAVLSLISSYAIEMFERPNVQSLAAYGGRRPAHFTQIVRRANFQLRAGLDDGRATFLVEAIDVSIISERRGGKSARLGEALAIVLRARVGMSDFARRFERWSERQT